MLEEILMSIHNFFVVKGGVHKNKYAISSGTIELDFLQDGQYFRIIGSVFNNGVYQYPASGLTDEEFDGEIWAMAVPPALITLSDEITDWVSNHKNELYSPYQSESFGGYSYTKATPNQGTAVIGWKDVFSDKLSPWRKIS